MAEPLKSEEQLVETLQFSLGAAFVPPPHRLLIHDQKCCPLTSALKSREQRAETNVEDRNELHRIRIKIQPKQNLLNTYKN